MTCILSIKIAKEFKLDIKETKFKISEEAISISGTSAELQYRDILSINDLLYGLMLPSGNDAA